jgi:tRNA (guanine-N7-)-methyltransferase
MTSPKNPYADCPKLPEDEVVPLASLVTGEHVELEIGPGRGGFIFERAAAAPEAAIVGMEVRRKWATIVDRRLDKQGLGKRCRVFAEDAKLAMPKLSPSGSVKRVFMHFPDPWWKKRHEKRLVMGDVFLDQVARLLVPGGELFVQTDVEERAQEYEAVVSAHGAFVPAGDREGSAWLAENPYGARSPREHRAIADGLPVHRMRYTRK